jgi:flagellar protein FliO/FliZ
MRHNLRHNPGFLCDIIILLLTLAILFNASSLSAKKKRKKIPGKKVAIAQTEKKVPKNVPLPDKNSGENEDKDKKDKAENNPLQKEYTNEDFKPAVEEESYGWLIFKTILIMGLIVAGFYYFLRYVTRKTAVQVLGQDAVQVLSMVPIGQNKYLQIVDLAGKIFVLGIAESSINLITEINDKSEIDRIRLLSSKSSGERGKGFQEYVTRHLGGLLGKLNEKRSESLNHQSDFSSGRESGTDLDYLKKQRKRLRNLNGFNDE